MWKTPAPDSLTAQTSLFLISSLLLKIPKPQLRLKTSTSTHKIKSCFTLRQDTHTGTWKCRLTLTPTPRPARDASVEPFSQQESETGGKLCRCRARTTVHSLSDQPSAIKAVGQTGVGTRILAWEAELNVGPNDSLRRSPGWQQHSQTGRRK